MKFAVTVLAAIGSMLVATMTAAPTYAAHAATTPTGKDVSYPQCGKTLPSGQAFGIVAVNDGTANTTNPCLATELRWAQRSTGTTSQPKVSLYVNTANPGNLGVADWPATNVDPVDGAVISDPYGTCTGGDDAACAWQYGWDRADVDAQVRGVANPGGYTWWLDVETGNSWESSTQHNDADLDGMFAYFESIGGGVGIYSTTFQWGQIGGTVASSSSLYSAADWIPGAGTLSEAKSNCGSRPLTDGGRVIVTQWTSSIDGDYPCV